MSLPATERVHLKSFVQLNLNKLEPSVRKELCQNVHLNLKCSSKWHKEQADADSIQPDNTPSSPPPSSSFVSALN